MTPRAKHEFDLHLRPEILDALGRNHGLVPDHGVYYLFSADCWQLIQAWPNNG